MEKKKIPLALKWIYLAFMAILIPTYWVNYGPANFLWFSDVTLMLAFLAVMFESRLFASMAAIGGLVLESYWLVVFIFTLFFNIHLSDLTDYMFDPNLPIWLRLLSLFHVVLPPLLFWLIMRLGYDKRAWFFQTGCALFVIAATWLFTDPAKNINWVFNYKKIAVLRNRPLLYLILEALIIVGIFTITHLALKLFERFRQNVWARVLSRLRD